MGKLSRRVAIIGAGMSPFGMLYPKWRIADLWQEAWINATKSIDHNFDVKDVQEMFVGNFTADLFNHQGHIAPLLADLAGICPNPSTRFEAACCSSGLAFRQAVVSVASGLNDLVCVAGVESMNEQDTAGVTDALAAAADVTFEYFAGATFPGLYAAIANAHMHKYGTKIEDLWRVGMKNHENGKQNPFAQMQMSIRDLMDSKIAKAKKDGKEVPDWKDEFDFMKSAANPMIAHPLRLFDCSLVTDGGACVFLASEDVAKKYTDTPIWVTGTGQGSASLSLHDRADMTGFLCTQTAAKQAFNMAGITPKQVQIAEVHDCFTIAEIVALEDLGIFEKGKVTEAVRNGVTKRNGDLPINTSGGLKSKGHPVGATGAAQVVEIFKQMRGIAERDRQVKFDVERACTQNMGGSGATAVVHVFQK